MPPWRYMGSGMTSQNIKNVALANHHGAGPIFTGSFSALTTSGATTFSCRSNLVGAVKGDAATGAFVTLPLLDDESLRIMLYKSTGSNQNVEMHYKYDNGSKTSLFTTGTDTSACFMDALNPIATGCTSVDLYIDFVTGASTTIFWVEVYKATHAITSVDQYRVPKCCTLLEWSSFDTPGPLEKTSEQAETDEFITVADVVPNQIRIPNAKTLPFFDRLITGRTKSVPFPASKLYRAVREGDNLVLVTNNRKPIGAKVTSTRLFASIYEAGPFFCNTPKEDVKEFMNTRGVPSSSDAVIVMAFEVDEDDDEVARIRDLMEDGVPDTDSVMQSLLFQPDSTQ